MGVVGGYYKLHIYFSFVRQNSIRLFYHSARGISIFIATRSRIRVQTRRRYAYCTPFLPQLCQRHIPDRTDWRRDTVSSPLPHPAYPRYQRLSLKSFVRSTQAIPSFMYALMSLVPAGKQFISPSSLGPAISSCTAPKNEGAVSVYRVPAGIFRLAAELGSTA